MNSNSDTIKSRASDATWPNGWSKNSDTNAERFAWGDSEIELAISLTYRDREAESTTTQKSDVRVKLTWEHLFACIAPGLIGWTPVREVQGRLETVLFKQAMEEQWGNAEVGLHASASLLDQQRQMTLIRSQLISRGLLDVDTIEKQNRSMPGIRPRSLADTTIVPVWKLTPRGVLEMSNRLAVTAEDA